MLKTGGTVSRTVILKELDGLTLPVASTAVQLTVVVPRAKRVPDSGEQVTKGFGSTASLAVTRYETVAPVLPIASVTIGGGKVSTGGV